MDEPKLISTWDELKECTSETHELEIEDHSGWVRRKERSDKSKDFFGNNHYLSTHTFYGSQYQISTKLLQKCGFNVRLANWDKSEG